jgi:hypothetical protein
MFGDLFVRLSLDLMRRIFERMAKSVSMFSTLPMNLGFPFYANIFGA